MEGNEAEKAPPKKWRCQSFIARYVNLLFPHTIKYNNKKATKGKRGRKVSGQKGQQASEEEVRESACTQHGARDRKVSRNKYRLIELEDRFPYASFT